jgi:hypothetical protein
VRRVCPRCAAGVGRGSHGRGSRGRGERAARGRHGTRG